MLGSNSIDLILNSVSCNKVFAPKVGNNCFWPTPETIGVSQKIININLSINAVCQVIFVMARPKKCRQISSCVPCSLFKPNGIPSVELTHIQLAADEFEALELGDVQRLSQLDAAALMGISRQTFGYLLASARKKVATAITQGQVLRLPSKTDKDLS